MTRRVIKFKSIPKQLNINGDIWDGYIGNRNIVWRLKFGAVEEFGVRCKCGLWYGWIDNIYNTIEFLKKLKSIGCSKCK